VLAARRRTQAQPQLGCIHVGDQAHGHGCRAWAAKDAAGGVAVAGCAGWRLFRLTHCDRRSGLDAAYPYICGTAEQGSYDIPMPLHRLASVCLESATVLQVHARHRRKKKKKKKRGKKTRAVPHTPLAPSVLHRHGKKLLAAYAFSAHAPCKEGFYALSPRSTPPYSFPPSASQSAGAASHLAGAGAQSSLPLLRVPADVLRGDERSMRLEALAPHAIETMQAVGAAQALDADLYRLRAVYGAAAAWERRMDLAAARATARLPGLPSSHCAVDTLLGRDDKIGFEDYLNSACVAAARRAGARGAHRVCARYQRRPAPPFPRARARAVPAQRPEVPKTGVSELAERVTRL
jgi:hypothetical protein